MGNKSFYNKSGNIKQIEKEYCKNYPVRKNKYGQMKDTSGRVGKYPDQYESLQEFVDDIWIRYRPFGGRCLFEKMGIIPDKNTHSLVCMNESSRFFGDVAENRYQTMDKYSDLKQHYPKLTN